MINILQNSFFPNFFATYILNATLNYTFKLIKKQFKKDDVSWQLFDCIEKSHRDTCKKLSWEYKPDAFINSFLFSLKESPSFLSGKNLSGIFTVAMGHTVAPNEIKCWEECFLERLSSQDYEKLREYIKLRTFLGQQEMSVTQKRYMNKMRQPYIKDGKDGKHFLTLGELYLPNEYKIGNNDKIYYDDLLELIMQFKRGNINEWIKQKSIESTYKIDALFIFGNQCAGKSALISKIILDHYAEASFLSTPLYVISFGDRDFRDKDITISTICEILSINRDKLSGSILLIDGLDESNLSTSSLLIDMENVINDLQELNCRLIITSRPNNLFAYEIKSALSITLQPFSFVQSSKWLEIYKKLDSSYDVRSKMNQIYKLSLNIRNIVLMPYIFYLCIVHNIAIDQITGLPKLYDILFCGSEAVFFKAPYDTKPKYREKEWEEFQEIIVRLSIRYFKSSDNTISVENADLEPGNDSKNVVPKQILSEFFLFQKDEHSYSFAHDSIPHYFIAKMLYESVKKAEEKRILGF